jgi:hypothetical protein
MGPSKTPTKLEREWMSRIVEHGCIACDLDKGPPRPAAVHHICKGFRRLGHLFTLPLCDPGHHKNGKSLGLVGLHDAKRTFEAKYGTEMELLANLQVKLGVYDKVTT